VCDALAVPDPGWYPQTVSESAEYLDALRTSLDHGYAGLALFWCALADVDPRAEQACYRYITAAFESFEKIQANASLYEGFSGVAYVAEVVRRRFPGWFSDDDDVNDDVDRVLLEYLGKTSSEGPNDLTMGVAGIGLYLMRRLPRSRARQSLDLILARLQERANRDEAGTYWLADPATQRRQPQYTVNGGVAHGVPGILGFLSRAVKCGSAGGPEGSLLEQGVEWLLRQRRFDTPAIFPDMWGATSSYSSRLAWCYSDLPIAIVLLHCGETCAVPRWTEAGLETARAAARRDVPSTEVLGDTSICHGTGGVAHMFNRILQFTGDRSFQDAAEAWTRATLERWSPDTVGVGGFKSRLSVDGGRNVWDRNPGVLLGAAGVGLALSSSMSDEPPIWDEMFLIDLPH
jgi:lantibiotic modifying enzyme